MMRVIARRPRSTVDWATHRDLAELAGGVRMRPAGMGEPYDGSRRTVCCTGNRGSSRGRSMNSPDALEDLRLGVNMIESAIDRAYHVGVGTGCSGRHVCEPGRAFPWTGRGAWRRLGMIYWKRSTVRSAKRRLHRNHACLRAAIVGMRHTLYPDARPVSTMA